MYYFILSISLSWTHTETAVHVRLEASYRCNSIVILSSSIITCHALLSFVPCDQVVVLLLIHGSPIVTSLTIRFCNFGPTFEKKILMMFLRTIKCGNWLGDYTNVNRRGLFQRSNLGRGQGSLLLRLDKQDMSILSFGGFGPKEGILGRPLFGS